MESFVPEPFVGSHLRSDGAHLSYKISRAAHNNLYLDETATGCLTMFALSSWGGRDQMPHRRAASQPLKMNIQQFEAYTCARKWSNSMGRRLGARDAELLFEMLHPQRLTLLNATPGSWRYCTTHRVQVR